MVTLKKLSKERAAIVTGWPLLNTIVILMLHVCVCVCVCVCMCMCIVSMLYLNEEPCTMDESNKND